MKLFLKPGACSLASHIVLEELGRPYETEAVDLAKKVTASGADFWAINPKGYVPALLLDDGDLLTEGPAILQYLADQVPELNLAPANGSKAGKARNGPPRCRCRLTAAPARTSCHWCWWPIWAAPQQRAGNRWRCKPQAPPPCRWPSR